MNERMGTYGGYWGTQKRTNEQRHTIEETENSMEKLWNVWMEGLKNRKIDECMKECMDGKAQPEGWTCDGMNEHLAK